MDELTRRKAVMLIDTDERKMMSNIFNLLISIEY
jgi:hypothetical protein